MRLIAIIATLTPLLACDGAEADPDPIDSGPCAPHEDPLMEVANGAHGYGQLGDEADILYGFPPQGGAPYVGFDVRVHGLDQDDTGLFVEITATEDDGTEMAYASFNQRFLCGNTGDNADWWVTSELHILFFGYSMEDLAEHPAAFELRAENTAGDAVSTQCAGSLIEDL